jgi:uncharacterized protein (TIGR03000 family)
MAPTALTQDKRPVMKDLDEAKVRAAFSKYISDPAHKAQVERAEAVAELDKVKLDLDLKGPSLKLTFPARKEPPGSLEPVRSLVNDFLGKSLLKERDWRKLKPNLVVSLSKPTAPPAAEVDAKTLKDRVDLLEKQVAALVAVLDKEVAALVALAKGTPSKKGVSDLEDKVKALEAQIGDLTGKAKAVDRRVGDLADKVKPIPGLVDKAKTAASSIADLEGKAKTTVGAVANLADKLKAAEGQVAELENKAKTAATAVTDLESKVKPLPGLEGRVAGLEGKAKTAAGAVTDLEGRVGGLEGKSKTAAGAVKELESKAKTNASSIADLEGKLKAADRQVADLETRAKSAAAVIADLSDKLKAADRQVMELSEKVKPIPGLVDKAKSTAGAVTELEGKAKTAAGAIAGLASKVKPIPALEGRLGDLEAKVQAQEIRGAARVTVLLPEGASLYVNGEPCPLTGQERSFFTPVMEPGRYSYSLRAELRIDGSPRTASRRVFVVPGKETIVDLRDALR